MVAEVPSPLRMCEDIFMLLPCQCREDFAIVSDGASDETFMKSWLLSGVLLTLDVKMKRNLNDISRRPVDTTAPDQPPQQPNRQANQGQQIPGNAPHMIQPLAMHPVNVFGGGNPANPILQQHT